jgi:hypothetical protein
VTGRLGLTVISGSLVFLGITLFEQIPVVGWLGALASLGQRLWLAGEVRRGGGNTVDAAMRRSGRGAARPAGSLDRP